MKSSAGPNQTNAYGTAASENQAQTNLLNQADSEFSQFIGPNGVNTNSPFYKSLVTTGTDSTATAYQNAKSNMAASSNAAGFGYASPAAQGGNAQVAQQEASAVGKVPTQATQTAADYGLKAALGIQGSAGQEGQQSLGYEDAGVSLQNNQANNEYSLLNSIIGGASRVAAAGAAA